MFNMKVLLIPLILVLVDNFVEGYERTYSSCNDFKLTNGRMRITPRRKLAKFQCNKGYILAGGKYSYCIHGKFDVAPPVCVKQTCSAAKQLSNGNIFLSYFGGVMNFYCKPGFILRGANVSYCDGTTWSDNLPACISSHSRPATSCDFETEDLCGWSQDLNHDFDWRRQNFQTPSGHIGTGPKNDHTKGENQNGYYVYIESTSRIENDVARLISPLYSAQPNGMCFTFWYHMYGTGIGQLRIYVKKETQMLRRLQPKWVEKGNQGDVWQKGRVIIEEGITEDFQIILEGVRGQSYISDIAVDDVELFETCPDDLDMSTTTVSSTADEPDAYFPSCLNRCNESSTDTLSNDTICECNDSCYEKNICCPDYTVVCLIAQFEDYVIDTTEIYSSTQIFETESEEHKSAEAKITSTIQVYLNTTPVNNATSVNPALATANPYEPTPSRTTESKVLRQIDERVETTKNTKTTFKTTLSSTNVPTISTTSMFPKINTIKSFKLNIVTFKNNKSKPLPTTDYNIDANNIVPQVNKNIKNNTNLKQRNILPKIQTTIEYAIATKNSSLPMFIKDIESTSAKTQTLEIETDYKPLEKPEVFKDTTVTTHVQMLSQNEEIVTFTDSIHDEPKLSLIIFGTSAIIIACVIIGVIVIKRRSIRKNLSRFGFKNSRNHDSMSDVRFLASDDILDFSLRIADN